MKSSSNISCVKDIFLRSLCILLFVSCQTDASNTKHLSLPYIAPSSSHARQPLNIANSGEHNSYQKELEHLLFAVSDKGRDLAPYTAAEQPGANNSRKKTTNAATQQRSTFINEKHSDKYGQPVTIRISAANLERKRIAQNGTAIVRFILTGQAHLQHNHINIYAAKIVLDNTGIGTIKGRVHIYDRQSKAHIYANGAHYDRKAQLLQMKNKPYLIRRNQTEPFLVSCENIKYYIAAKRVELQGDVRAHHGPRDLLGDRGVYQIEARQLKLEKGPLAISESMYLIGSQLNYQEAKGQIEFTGEPVLYWQRDLRPAANIKPSTSRSKLPASQADAEMPKQSILSADVIQYHFSKYLEAHGNVIVTQKNMRLTTSRLRFFGTQMRHVSASDGVHMIDHERRVEYKARDMFFDAQKQTFSLRHNAWFLFYANNNEEDNVPTVLSAGFIKRDLQKKEILMQSRVQLRQKNYSASSEIARYYEDRELIIMEGNPALRRANSSTSLQAEKIFIYPRQNQERILFHNRIRGTL